MEQYVALYARVSTLNQETGLQSQVRALEAYAKANGLTSYKLFTDEVSGRRSSRPGLDAMLATAEAGEISSIVVYSLSRFSRSVKHLLASLDTFTRLNIAFVSLTESLNTSTPTGRAIITIISAIAQLEADLIKERVKSGLENARAKGVKLGAPKKYTDKVTLVAHLASQDLSHREIARLTGVSQSTISRMIKVFESELAA